MIDPKLKKRIRDYLNIRSELRPFVPDDQSLIDEYLSLQSGDGDDFFSKWGAGIDGLNINRPFERAKAYENLLKTLKEIDQEKFYCLHKGTPYFFIGWACIQYEDFEKALYYLDAAISEDLIKTNYLSRQWNSAAFEFFLLKDSPNKSVGPIVYPQLRKNIDNILKTFSTEFDLQFKKEDLVGKFIEQIFLKQTAKKERVLITSLYRILIENEKVSEQLNLRSGDGGTIEPFVNNLFDAARLLESILGTKSKGPTFEKKALELLDKLEIDKKALKGKGTIKSALNFYEGNEHNFNQQSLYFGISHRIRNSTGHILIWEDDFTEENYKLLYDSLIMSIFWSIFKLYIDV